jgi:hypothetical protein
VGGGFGPVKSLCVNLTLWYSKSVAWYLCCIAHSFSLRRLSCDRAYGTVLRTLYTRMCHNLVQMVPDRRLCYRAHVARVRLEHVGVVGGEDCGSGADDRAERVVHLLSFGLLYVVLEDGALGRGGGGAGHGRVRGEVVVVVCCCSYDWAL